MRPISSYSTPLGRILLVDSIASGAMGVLFLLDAAALESLLGLPASLLRGVGVLLIPFAGFLVWLAPRASALRVVVRSIVGANVLWVIASLLLLVSGRVNPTPVGTVFVVLQAAAVTVVAYLEYRAVGRVDSVPVTAGT